MSVEYCRYCNAPFLNGRACRTEEALKTCPDFAALTAENAKFYSPPADTKESVQAEIDYFEKHADRFAEAHKGIAGSVVSSQERA